MDNNKIADFYDDFSEQQYKTGTNERLISLYKRLKKWGLKKNSSVLEMGCGVGIFSKLMLKTVKSGYIESVDLSPRSIEIAQKFIKNPQITFKTADVVNYGPEKSSFDFITLMDVIEHIPLEKHRPLFQNIAEIAGSETLILINIPNPRYIEYMQREKPETLQVIDQPVELSSLAENADRSVLEIIYFEKYSIWEQNDYDFIVMRKKQQFSLTHLSDLRTVPEKISRKISHKVNRIKYS